MKDLTVFILTHNRGPLLLETLYSVLDQDCNDFKLVVSDNSSNNETELIIRNNNILHKLEYRKRNKEYTALEHFNLCLNEVDTEYFILFHDDDIMKPNMISTLYSYINGSIFVCVGPNSNLLLGDKKTKQKNLKFSRNRVITSSSELIFQYCRNRIAVFPGYIYSKSKIKNNIFFSDAGKYSDVTWLIRLIQDFPFLWLKDSLMFYRIHSGQDSQIGDLESQLRLVRKWKKENLSRKTRNSVNKFYISLLYSMDCKNRKCKNVYIYMKYSFFKLFPKVMIKKLLRIF